jgi:hypothetical protein
MSAAGEAEARSVRRRAIALTGAPTASTQSRQRGQA